MLATVEFDHKAPVDGGEVDDIGSDRRLPTEVHAQAPGAQVVPETPLGVRHALAQGAGAIELDRAHRIFGS
jgi:hypothetical protein